MTSADRTLLLDAHVHLYDCFDPGRFLDAARGNFARVGSELSVQPDSLAQCLLCVDLQYRSLEAALGRLQAASDYELLATAEEEPYSRTLRHRKSGDSVQMVWGYQIITAEKLEVLAFGLAEPIEHGLPLEKVLQQLGSSKAPQSFGILPWGFGKWWGQRGELVDEALSGHAGTDASPWFVGDNGGRWRQLPQPRLINKAVGQKHVWNICGSDPLPFPEQAERVGSRGVVLNGRYDALQPCGSVRQLLLSLDQQPEQFGEGERLLRFIKAQVGMQMRKTKQA